MANTVNKPLLEAILRKRRDSEPLNNEEEAYSRQVFSDLMGSKKQVRKVVRIVTGEQLRKEAKLEKSKTDAAPTRKDPRYPQGTNYGNNIEGDNPNPKIDTLKVKIPDVDEKPKTGPHPGLEQDRLSSMTQEAVPPRPEATSKFTSADPVKAGDIVAKNMAREGQHIVKGVVLKVQNDVAFVKWADGRTMTEPSHLLVKVKAKKQEDPKLGPSDEEEEAHNVPMTKNGDIASVKDYSTPGRVQTTPFEDLTSSLQRVISLASDLKEMQERTNDADIKDHYEGLIGKLRECAETILSGLSMELSEAQAEADE